ncbi:hypothetical protein BpHYR1_020449 [Brachionus plicatilis]|uniref:Uncharacterized protein n=1 Tax=Brachionus plicatilis TaxID=10195 RepID=A0A3M7PYN0_BRAPC|nr:hypothetical protein BpHYR1_020449 [Brachionus plicatilis]
MGNHLGEDPGQSFKTLWVDVDSAMNSVFMVFPVVGCRENCISSFVWVYLEFPFLTESCYYANCFLLLSVNRCQHFIDVIWKLFNYVAKKY